MNTSKVAIILTTFNGEKYLTEQLDSLLYQKKVNLDVYVFDDGSSDKTLQILSEYQNNLNIIILPNTINSGGTGKNILINLRDFEESKILEYDYFSLCDQDDIWLCDKLLRAIGELKRSGSSLYCSNLSMWNAKSGVTGTIKKNYPIAEYDYLFEGGSAGCTYVMTSDFLLHVNKSLKYYPIECKDRISHDWILYFLARLDDFNVVFDQESKILYRIHENNQYGHLSNFSISSLKSRIQLLKKRFYQTQILNNLHFIEKDTVEYKIYKLYAKSISSRIYVLFYYNFSLMRKKSKFIVFLFLSIFFVKTFDINTIMTSSDRTIK